MKFTSNSSVATHRKPASRAPKGWTLMGVAALLGASVLATSITGTASATEPESQLGTVMGGRAYSIGVSGTSILGAPVPDGASPDTGYVASTGTDSFTRPCTDVSLGFVSATANCVLVATDAEARTSTATTSLATARLGITGIPAVDLKGVSASSWSSCNPDDPSHGSVTIAYLKVGSKVLIAQPTPIAPNTVMAVGPITLTLNEQFEGRYGYTVNAVHLGVNVPGVARTSLVVSSATSQVGRCYFD